MKDPIIPEKGLEMVIDKFPPIVRSEDLNGLVKLGFNHAEKITEFLSHFTFLS